MSLKFPNADLPRSVTRGGDDVWETPQASVLLNGEFFEVIPDPGVSHSYVARGSQSVSGWDYLVPTGATDTAIDPGAGSLVITGYAPSVSQPQAIDPAAGSITITGYAPTVTRTTGSSYGVAHSYVNRGSQAVISWMADGLGVDAGAITPGAGTLTITGYAPTIGQTTTTAISPGVGSLTFTGYAPTVAQAANQAVNPGVGSLAITGYAPSVAQSSNVALNPAAGALSITGYAPTVAQSSSVSLVPDAGTLAITGYAPSVVQTVSDAVIGVVHTYVGRGSVQVVSWLSDGISEPIAPPEPEQPCYIGGWYHPRRKKQIPKEVEPEVFEAIEAVAEVAVSTVDAQAEMRRTLENIGFAYKEAYQEIYLELIAEMRQAQEDEQIAAIVAALL